MPGTRGPYPEEFRRQMVELVRTGVGARLDRGSGPTGFRAASAIPVADARTCYAISEPAGRGGGRERGEPMAADRDQPTGEGTGPLASIEARARELRILSAISEALNASTDVQQALERSLGLVAELLGLETGWVWLLDRKTEQFYCAAARNLPPYLREPVRMSHGECHCIGAFTDGDLTPKNINVLECSRLRPAVERNDTEATRGLAYHASIPLYFQDKPLGIMNITGPAWRRLSPAELQLLSTIAYQVGVAVERARMAEGRARLARAEERARIAREIHDTLAQRLTGIALQLEGAGRHLESDPARARKRLERALAAAREGLEEARRSVLNLRADPLDGKTLQEALGALTRAFTSETGVRVRRQVGLEGDLPPGTEAEVYRIVEEALTNVRRHAEATEVRLELRAGKSLGLLVRDDGRGFDPDAVPEQRYGLMGMRERAELLDGHLRIRSVPGRGTVVALRAPLDLEEPR